MRNIILLLFIVIFSTVVFADNSPKVFTKSEIENLSPKYLNNSLKIDKPAIVDVDKDGDFDILSFNDGNVEYYKNTGSLENPEFVLENKNYDSYNTAFFTDGGMPMPIFFADKDGDGDMDLFAVKGKEFNNETKTFNYKISSAENTVDLDTGTLITIILILVIVLLILAIAGR